MKSQISKLALLFLIILMSSGDSYAEQPQPISEPFNISQLMNRFLPSYGETQPDTDGKLGLSAPIAIAGVLCFVAASISSAGGVGGGGLFIPILTIAAGLDLKTASSFSAFMVTGASVANVICNLASARNSLIDFDIALLSQPSMLLGVSVGVICNLVFPEWLITVLFAVFLAWSTSKTFKNGVVCWSLETEELRTRKGCEAGTVEEEPLLGDCESSSGLPWIKIGVLVLVWLSFCFLYLLRGNRYGEGITPIEPCGVAYWLLSAFQIPLAIIYIAWILYRKDRSRNQSLSQKDVLEELAQVGHSNKLMFPIMALLAGILGGVFGIGGGMLISPLLLQVGIGPKVTAATCSFMVFFSATMSAFQYLLLGMEHLDVALLFAAVCFIASLLGLVVVQKAVQEYGRASLIVFSVGLVMALSTILMTGYGALDVWRAYLSGEYMGFKLPC